jgi:hypothetical protein
MQGSAGGSIVCPSRFSSTSGTACLIGKVDGKWFRRLGGYLGGEEPSAEKVNAGQKAWYWFAMLTLGAPPPSVNKKRLTPSTPSR